MAVKLLFTRPDGTSVRTCLSTDAKPNATVGSHLYYTDEPTKLEMMGSGWEIVGVGGAASVRQIGGTGQQNRNRYQQLDNAGTRLKVEWPSGANITDLTFFASPIPGSTLAGDEVVLVAIDSVDDAAADNALTQTPSATDDVQWIPIPMNKYISLPQSSALSNGSLGGGRVDAKTIGGVAVDLFIGAS